MEINLIENIYYLTGRGGKLNKGLGEALIGRAGSLSGREMSGEFAKLPFQSQIDLITQDLQKNFWHMNARVVAVSYGAYLLLHALVELVPYPGDILLLSPVLGGVTNGDAMRYFSPPRSDKLMKLIEDKKFPVPNKINIHVGDTDWQSPRQRSEKFMKLVEGKCSVLPNTGHNLDKNYVASVLDEWLSCDPTS